MTKLTLPIQIGRRYVRRDGSIVEARPPHKSITSDCAYVGDAEGPGPLEEHVWRQTGMVSKTGRKHILDLIADAPDERVAEPTTPPAPAAATTHPNADLIRALLDGKQLQRKANEWRDVEPSDVEMALGELAHPECGWYRLKLSTIRIGDREVPEPLRVAPLKHTPFWLACPVQGERTQEMEWLGNDIDRRWLADGLVHLTPEAAQAHARALLSFTTEGEA